MDVYDANLAKDILSDARAKMITAQNVIGRGKCPQFIANYTESIIKKISKLQEELDRVVRLNIK